LITTKDENPEAGRKRESPKEDEGYLQIRKDCSRFSTHRSMMKVLFIALKDLLITTRDRSGFLLMLAAPLALTLVVAFAFGGLGGGTSGTGLADIPVAIVNLDDGPMSLILIDVFESEDLAGLVEPTSIDDPDAARRAVDEDRLAAAVIIPPDFSTNLMDLSQPSGGDRPVSIIEVYANPSRPIGSGVIHSIVDTILSSFNTAAASVEVTVYQMIASGRIQPAEAAAVSARIASQAAVIAQQTDLVSLQSRVEGSQQTGFNFLNYMAPSMAILYLTFTMANAGRSILAERDAGTLPRMLITPSRRIAVLGGKMLGVYLIGLMQMTIVLIAGAFLFNISWGDPLAVILLTMALVGAASGWGVAIAAFARTPSQAGSTAMAINLIFAGVAGNFIPRSSYPLWLQNVGLITPNAWGIEGYWNLIYGGTLSSALPGILALLAMTVILFAAAVFTFRRQYKG
jgi:ABC-2 type transport system permease protein